MTENELTRPEKRLDRIAHRKEVWLTRGGEINDWYRANYMAS